MEVLQAFEVEKVIISSNNDRPIKPYKKRKIKIKDDDCVAKNIYLQWYVKELNDRNAACVREHHGNIGYFLRYMHKQEINFQIQNMSSEHINMFEMHLAKRVENKEIKLTTAYTKLQYLSHFLRFLCHLDITHIDYKVPERFKGSKVERDNEYVHNQDRLAFFEAICRSNGRRAIRDLAICLLLNDTGCRPIEIANLELIDFNAAESTIILNSRKSGQRKLKIHPFVCKHVKRYVEIRKQLPGRSLFLLDWEEPIHSGAVVKIVRRYVQKAFGELRFSAKSLRHTCITNQLNNRNDIEAVAHAAGHKHLVSTLHYFYRDIEMLLEHSLPHNPMKGIDNNEL
ncbi:site-specific recombinase XerD [Paenibacillus phyllosphaerae]|uniref:Site-specific recombinase XerD n=1 Tax=Paenibacillus phyllosphaerae TaxID=274593 RepID=A0A7W5AU42_9BACL|nr:site-specific integrase [Paenibacillus phyllosphaerae]MBB3108171.1 site-specific recombinase XerD [Paenibacillus phyllosphaerae]